MEFPEREEDILQLALRMAEVIEQHPDVFPAPPVSPAHLRAMVEVVKAINAECALANERYREQRAKQGRTLARVKDVLKANLMYTEMDVRGQPERLSGLGWGGRPGATDRELPGEVRDLTAQRLGDTSVVLEWRPPVDGGPAAEYRVQRRKLGGPWEHVAREVDNDCLVSHQPQGVEFDLRVVAVNQAGAGQPSATVTVVL